MRRDHHDCDPASTGRDHLLHRPAAAGHPQPRPRGPKRDTLRKPRDARFPGLLHKPGPTWLGPTDPLSYGEVEVKRSRGGIMGEKHDRDVEKVYSTSEFVAKLRRLADSLEAGERFEIRVAGERVYVPARAEFNVEHEREGDEEEIEFQLKWTNSS